MKTIFFLSTILLAAPAAAADALLSGTVSSTTGQRMAGVTVSAKADGGTVKTSVYTDKAGNYYFSPMPAGKYRIWVQAVGFETARGEVDLAANRKHDVKLATLKDPELVFRQLPGYLALAALPEETDHDKLMKQILR